MKKTLLFSLILLFGTSCATPALPPLQNLATPTVKPPEPTKPTSPTATHTPWPTLVSPETPGPQPSDASAVALNVTPILSTAPTRVTLFIICPSDNLSPTNGYGLVAVTNFIGQSGWAVEVSIGGIVCSVPPGKGGYVQLRPGTYSWTAKVPVRGGLGNTQGNIAVGLGNSNGEIVFCIVEDHLASAPQCPSGGPGVPGINPQSGGTPLPR